MIVKPYYNFYNDINSAGLTLLRFGAFSTIPLLNFLGGVVVVNFSNATFIPTVG